MKRILIVDDHAIVRKGVKETLQDMLGHTALGEAASAAEALDFIKSGIWDLVLLDIGLGEHERSGLEVLEKIHQSHPNLPVLILSQYAESEYGVRAIKLGAAGYVTKEMASQELISAIHRVLAGGKFISPTLAERLATEVQQRTVPLHETLSPREFEIMVLIAQGKSLKEIAASINLSTKTVGTYHLRIFSKMGIRSDVGLTRYAILNKLVN